MATLERRSRARRLYALAGAGAFLLALYLLLSLVILGMALHPHRSPASSTPLQDGFQAEAVHFDSAEDHLALTGWFLRGNGQRAVVVLHGLDSHGWNRYSKALSKALLEHGFSILIFDFRGQGESAGDQLGLGWLERRDVRGAVDLLLHRGFAPGSIGLNGSSYGAATALLAAAAIPEVGAVVADSPFADVRDLMGQEMQARVGAPFLFLRGMVLMGKWRYGLDLAEIPPINAVPRIAPRPILFVHGDQDGRIPVEHSRRLKAASRGSDDQLWIVPGADHTGEYKLVPDEYFPRVVGFFEAHLR